MKQKTIRDLVNDAVGDCLTPVYVGVLLGCEPPIEPIEERKRLVLKLSIEERVRLTWRVYKEYKSKRQLAKSRQEFKGSKTETSMHLIVEELGLKPANYYYAEKTVNLADELMKRGKVAEANTLLFLLNNKSVNAARIECDRLLAELD